MDLQIFVLGDVRAFTAALNSVAMVLGVDSFLSGAALLGAFIGLIAFILYLFNKEAGAQIMRGGSPLVGLVVFFLFFSTIQIKSKVIIEDAFTGNVAVVDGVPVLVSIPASIISTTAHKVFEHSNTSYQSTSGSFMPLGTTGFVQPMRVLMALREGIDKTDPLLSASLRQYIVDCTLGTSLDLDKLEHAPDSLEYILNNGRPTGITVEFTSAAPTGQATSCLQLSSSLRARVEGVINVAAPGLNGQSRLEASVNRQLPNRAASGQPMESAEITQSVEQVVINSFKSANQNANQFMMNAMIYNTATNAFGCLGKAGDMREFSNCDVMLTQAHENWKTESAGAGTLFTKTMLPAMVFLQLMFYTLAPIVIAFALIKGVAGISLYIKYLGFGVWTMSWLPVAAGIQMYIQNNVQGKLEMIAERAMTFGNFKSIYADTLSVNLALASDMLAATPLVTGTILGVSAMAMTSLTSRMGGMSRMDGTLQSPTLNSNAGVMSQAAAVNIGSAVQGNPNSGLAKAGHSFTDISSGNVLGNASQSASGEKMATSAAAAQALSDSAEFMRRHTTGDRTSAMNMTAFDNAKQKNEAITKSIATDFAKTHTWKEGESAKFDNAIKGDVGFTTPFASVKAAFQSAKGRQMDKAEEAKFMEKYGTQIQESNSLISTMRQTAQNSLDNYSGSERARSQGLSAQLTTTHNAQAAAEKSYNEVVSAQQTLGSNFSVKENDLGYQILSNPQAAKMLRDEVAKRPDAAFQGAAHKHAENLANKGDFVGVDQAGQFRALMESKKPEDQLAAARIFATLGGGRAIHDVAHDKHAGVGHAAAAVQLTPVAPAHRTPAGGGGNASSSAVLKAAGGQVPAGKPLAPPLNVTGAPQPSAGSRPSVPAASGGQAVSAQEQPLSAQANAPAVAQGGGSTSAPAARSAAPAPRPANRAQPQVAAPVVAQGGGNSVAPATKSSAPAQRSSQPPMPADPGMPEAPGMLPQSEFDNARARLAGVESAQVAGRQQIESANVQLTPEQIRDTMGLDLYKNAGAGVGMKWDEFKQENPKTAMAIEAVSFLVPAAAGVNATRGAMAAVRASRAVVAKKAEKVAELSKGWSMPKGGGALTHSKVPNADGWKELGFKSEGAFIRASKEADEALLDAQKKAVSQGRAYLNAAGAVAQSKTVQTGALVGGVALGSNYAQEQHEIRTGLRSADEAERRIAQYEDEVRQRYAASNGTPAQALTSRAATTGSHTVRGAAPAPAPAIHANRPLPGSRS